MKNTEDVKILGVDVANTNFEYKVMKKEFENMILSTSNLKWHQKIYIRILIKTNGLFTRVYNRKRL